MLFHQTTASQQITRTNLRAPSLPTLRILLEKSVATPSPSTSKLWFGSMPLGRAPVLVHAPTQLLPAALLTPRALGRILLFARGFVST